MPYAGRPKATDLPELDDDLTLPAGISRRGNLRRGTKQPIPKRARVNQGEINGYVPPVLTEMPLANAVIPSGMDGNRSAPLFDKDRTFNANDHDWRHEGMYIVCYTCPENNAHAVRIGPHVQLLGERGNWRLAPNGALCRHGNVLSTCQESHPEANFKKVIVT